MNTDPFRIEYHPVFAYRCPGVLYFFQDWAARIEASLLPFDDDYQKALTQQKANLEKLNARPRLR